MSKKTQFVSKTKPTVTFTCSKHGEQPFVACHFAGFVIGCGCSWTNSNSKLRWEDYRSWWAFRDWLGKPRFKNS